MGKSVLRSYLLLVFLVISISGQAAISYKGIWHGVITSDELINETQYTLNIKVEEGNILTGRAYLYNNFMYVFYGIFDFIGTVENDKVRITELRIRSSEIPDTLRYLCIKYGNMLYSANDTAEYLTGKWGNSKGSCPTGEVYLKRIIQGRPSNITVPDVVMAKIREDKSDDIPFMTTTLMKPVIVDIRSPSVKLSIYDYMREDNDTVSVFLNRQPLISRLKIRKKAYVKEFKLDRLSSLNELILYAENLGAVPPNTCVLVIDDGSKKQSVNISSTMQKSASIYLRYEPDIH